jgi:methylglutaconyl-CoA hydratase
MMNAQLKTLILTELDQVLQIKLNRPEVRNAFNSEMIKELSSVFKALQQRSDIKVMTLVGEGKAFCAGADLNWMRSMVNYNFEENILDAKELYQLFEAQSQLDIPLIGLVHGAVYGGALGLIANCDYVIAEKGTNFCFSEVKLGISPAVISSFVLKKANPLVHHYMLSASVFDENQAKELFLVNEICSAGRGHSAIQTHLHQYKECSPQAVRKTKKLLRELRSLGTTSPESLTTKLIAELRVSSEGQEGIKSFLEKSSPIWKKN